MNTLVFDIPECQSVKRLESRLQQRLNIQSQPSETVTRTCFDTFDWRIHKSGGVLELTTRKSGQWLTWRELRGDRIVATQQLEDMPTFVWNRDDSGLLVRLKPIVGVRALLPVACVNSRTTALRMLDKAGKTTLRMEIQVDQPRSSARTQAGISRTPPIRRIHLFPLKGYARSVRTVRRFLTRQCGLAPAAEDPLIVALNAARQGFDSDTQSRPGVSAEQRADRSLKQIFQFQLAAMAINEAGMRADIDSEFLHEYRVAVRRTRALLSQAKGVLGQRSVDKYKREFAWLGAATGPTRDMDVYLLSFAAFQASLPETMRGDIVPLHDFLIRHKQREHRKLLAALDSVRYRRLIQDWRHFIGTPLPAHSVLAEARQPSSVYAGHRIWRIYRKALKQGRAISAKSPPAALHQLRKTCKKLRYMNEFFRVFYPRKKITPLIDSLKNLQNNLGEFQDLEVQQESLRHFIVDMELETGISSATRAAIQHLVASFERRETVVRTEFARRFARFASARNRKTYKALFATPPEYSGTGQ